MGNMQFDQGSVPQDDDFAAIPAGWYHVVIDGAEIVQSKDAEKAEEIGDMVKLKFIVNPEVHDIGKRSVFTHLCYQHSKETPRKIAQRQLAAICRAIELDGILEDTEQLLGAQLRIKVKVTPETDQRPAGNDIVAFKSLSEVVEKPAPAAAPARAAATPAAAPAATRSRPSWA
jgi:hypothetical protein